MDWVIVLAAGRGVRAGGPKALLVVNGRAWWRVQRERLERVGLPVVWVVSERVRAGMGEDAPERVVVADEMGPMFTSVVAGMRGVTGHSPRGVFVLPVDVPVPAIGIFQSLAYVLAQNTEAVAAVPMLAGERGHPVYVGWDFVTRSVLTADERAGRLDHLIGEHRVEVEVEDAGVLVNLNTVEEFAVWASQNG